MKKALQALSEGYKQGLSQQSQTILPQPVEPATADDFDEWRRSQYAEAESIQTARELEDQQRAGFAAVADDPTGIGFGALAGETYPRIPGLDNPPISRKPNSRTSTR